MALSIPANATVITVDTSTLKNIQLPLASSLDGRLIIIKDKTGNASTNPITLLTGGSDTFEDGTTSWLINRTYGSISLVARTGKWFLLSRIDRDGSQFLNLPAISSLSLQSTTTGITTLLTNTVASTSIGLGTFGYISTPSLQSTVTFLLSNTGGGGITNSDMNSTIVGLGNFGYISTPSLQSTTTGITTFLTNTVASTSIGLGTFGYISTPSLQSTVTFLLSNTGGGGISGSNLNSTILGLGTFGYLSSPTVLLSLSSGGIITSTIYAQGAFLRGLAFSSFTGEAGVMSNLTLSTINFYASTGYLAAPDWQVTNISSQTLQTSSITAGFITASQILASNLTYSSLTFQTGSGFFDLPDSRLSFLSANSIFANSMGANSMNVSSLTIPSGFRTDQAFFSSAQLSTLTFLQGAGFLDYPDVRALSLSTTRLDASTIRATDLLIFNRFQTSTIFTADAQVSSLTFLQGTGFVDSTDLRTTSLSSMRIEASTIRSIDFFITNRFLVGGDIQTSSIVTSSLVFNNATFISPGGFLDLPDTRTLTISTQILYTSSMNFNAFTATSLNASNITFSTLSLGPIGFFDGPASRFTSVSTQQIFTSSLNTLTYNASRFQLGLSTNDGILSFFGLNGTGTNTVLAEFSTGTASQEFLVFRGSSIADQIRLQTTGAIRFETGVPSRLFPNIAQVAIPTMVLTSDSNVGIRNSNPTANLDVLGTGKIQSLEVSSFTFRNYSAGGDFIAGSTNQLSSGSAYIGGLVAQAVIAGQFVGDGSQLTGILPGGPGMAAPFGSTLSMSTGVLRSGTINLGVQFV